MSSVSLLAVVLLTAICVLNDSRPMVMLLWNFISPSLATVACALSGVKEMEVGVSSASFVTWMLTGSSSGVGSVRKMSMPCTSDATLLSLCRMVAVMKWR